MDLSYLRAMPTLMAASPTLSISRLRIMHKVAPCSLPTMFSAGTYRQHKANKGIMSKAWNDTKAVIRHHTMSTA
jgi:hypothetical protein